MHTMSLRVWSERVGALIAAGALTATLLVTATGCHTRAANVSVGNEPTAATGGRRNGTQSNTTGVSTTRPGGTPERGAESPTKTVGLSPNSTAGANAGRRPVIEGNGTASHYGAAPYPFSSLPAGMAQSTRGFGCAQP